MRTILVDHNYITDIMYENGFYLLDQNMYEKIADMLGEGAENPMTELNEKVEELLKEIEKAGGFVYWTKDRDITTLRIEILGQDLFFCNDIDLLKLVERGYESVDDVLYAMLPAEKRTEYKGIKLGCLEGVELPEFLLIV